MHEPIESGAAWIELPARDYGPRPSISLQYGAAKVAGEYCRLRYIPTQIQGHWQHGWVPREFTIDPRQIPTETVRSLKTEPCWVARKDQEEYLQKHGYLARAIGLPIAYLPDRKYRRKLNSLLVMPAHSLDYTTLNLPFAEYAETIAKIKSSFSTVVACISPYCAKNGYWIKDFQRLGIPTILGADSGDQLSLLRIKALMSQFEFVTGNTCGSYIAYACAFGAKLSIYGPYCEIKAEDCEEDYFYQENPGLLKKILGSDSAEVVKSQFPGFFCHPVEAQERTDWGLSEIGYPNRIPPHEMKRCFGWTLSKKSIAAAKKRVHSLAGKMLSQKSKLWVKERVNPPLRAFKREVARLQDYPRFTVGHTTLHGESFHFGDKHSFLRGYKRIYQEHCYGFPCVKSDPVILDCGANIGLGVRYWKSKYPDAKILAFEPDPYLFELLKKNCQDLVAEQLCLRNEAVWREQGTLDFRSNRHETGQLSQLAEVSDGTIMTVNTVRLSDYLESEVDFLKINIEGAEVEVVPECGSRLKNVRRMYIEYHSYLHKEQRLDLILRVLREAGFRYHIAAENFSMGPFFGLPADSGIDQRLDVWAYRGAKFPRTFDRE